MNRRYQRKARRNTKPSGANANYLKGKKRALKKYQNKKKRFGNARRVFVEVKSQSHKDLWTKLGGSAQFPIVGDVISDPTELDGLYSAVSHHPLTSKMFVPWSFLNPIQAIGAQGVIGNVLTAKYLTAKIHFEFPRSGVGSNPRYYIIHGFVTVPMNLTQYTPIARSELTRTQLFEHIHAHVKRDFDEAGRTEFLRFNEKKQKDYTILGYKKITPNQNKLQVPVQVTYNSEEDANVYHGLPADKNIVLKWPVMNKKITYSHGKTTALTPPITQDQMMYPNKFWLPFWLFYSPDASQIEVPDDEDGEDYAPSIAYNDKFWFTDS